MTDAEDMGRVGAAHNEQDRLDFEDYMRGHCWEVGQWNGEFYTDTWSRIHFGVWRDCAKLQRDRLLAANRHLSDIANQAIDDVQQLQSKLSLTSDTLSKTIDNVSELRDEIDVLVAKLEEIGTIAHSASTGPSVPDVLWEIRCDAYAEVTASMRRMRELDA